MRRFALWGTMVSACLLLSVGCLGLAAEGDADSSQEPPLEYTVQIGDKSVQLHAGQTAKLEGSFQDPDVSISPAPYRTFPYQGMSFKYPSYFTFEADASDPSATIWTLSGPTCTVMIARMDANLSAADFAQQLIAMFGKENCRISDQNFSLSLGGSDYHGVRLDIRVGGQLLVQELVSIRRGALSSTILVLQDVPGDGGGHSEEYDKVKKVLSESFQVEK